MSDQNSMITDKELSDLPDDPETAFIQYENIVRNAMSANYDPTSFEAEKQYVTQIIGFIEEYNLDIGIDTKSPIVEFSTYFDNFTHRVDSFISRLRIRKIRGKNSDQSSHLISLTEDYRTAIHEKISLIRKIINSIEIKEDRREILFKNLNAFAAEVDKERTKIDTFTSVWLNVTETFGKGAENLEPAVKALERIARIFGKAKAEEQSDLLPPHQEKKLLEAPGRSKNF